MMQPQSAEIGLAAEALAAKPISHWRLAWWRLRRDKVSLAAAVVLFLIILAALLAPVIPSIDDPNVAAMKGNVINRILPIGSEGHVLGTDEQGRDMLSRLLYGGRMSLLAGFCRCSPLYWQDLRWGLRPVSWVGAQTCSSCALSTCFMRSRSFCWP